VLVEYVVKNHELRTGTEVQTTLHDLPDDLILSIKISLYRILQEGLSNAARHGHGVGQRVCVIGKESHLQVEIADSGPGFDIDSALDGREHLGLVGMRDRVESLGGQFTISSAPGQGTRINITLPLSDSRAEIG
jgi:signal transduction histidine kinase